MKATGIVRRIDDLGRVVIPKEIRRTMRIREGDPLEIYTDKDGEVIFKKYSPMGELSEFAASICETLSKTTGRITAVSDRDAVIAGEGNPNTAWLTFGTKDHKTEESRTITKTFGIDIVKTDSQHKLIDGAGFKIYDEATGGKEVKVVLMDDGVTYRRAREDETGVEIIVKDGQVRVIGFDNGNYYLEETTTPAGYNQLAARQAFIISDGNLDATFNDGVYSTGSGVHVVNKSGTMLPETGGIGTTMFYVIGGILVAGSLVFLVTKKRMGNQ